MWWHFIKRSDRNWATQIIIFVMLMITQILAARIWYLEYAKTMLIICIIRTLCIMMCSATTEKNLQFPLSKICRYMYKIIGRKNPEGENAFDCWCVIYPAREEFLLYLFGRYYLWESILQSPPSWALIANNTGLSGKSLENSFYGPPASRKWRGNDALMYWQMFLWETNTFNKCNGLIWLPINPPPLPPSPADFYKWTHISKNIFNW